MNLDLTGLAEAAQPIAGEPLVVPLGAIDRDPGQPRRHFDEATLRELADSILAVGVVQPVSVRPHPETPGRYILNYGERRYRASVIAGMPGIPAFVHRTPDDYSQVAENLHRADLSPMEMALFIKRRLGAGEKKNEIASRLGYKNGYVTEHLALLEAPPCVEKAYANGATSARTLYDLRRLHDEHPREVDAWCASGVEVTRDTVAALAQKFRRDEIPAGGARPEALMPSDDVATRDVQAPGAMTCDVVASASSTEADEASRNFRHDKAGASTARAAKPRARLVIRVEHGGRKGMIRDDSTVFVRYDDGGVAELRVADVVVLGTVAA